MLLALAACAGCGKTHLNRDVYKVVVVPPFLGDSNVVDAPRVLGSMIEAQVLAREYSIVPGRRTLQVLRINLAEEIRIYNAADLLKNFPGAQGILRTWILECAAGQALVRSAVSIRSELADLRSGEVLWRGSGSAARIRTTLAGIIGGLVSDNLLRNFLRELGGEAVDKCFRPLPYAGFDEEHRKKNSGGAPRGAPPSIKKGVAQ